MNLTPTTQRFVAVLNRKIDQGKLMNALGHMSIGLTSLYEDLTVLRLQTYTDKDNTEHKNISDNPFIVLKSDNSNQIRTLRSKLIEENIPFTDFINTMTEGNFKEQHERTNSTSEIDLEYYGICFFAEDARARELTRKFSLFQ